MHTMKRALTAVALLAFASCARAVPPCPTGYARDPDREARLRATLAHDPEAGASSDTPAALCFAPNAAGVVTGNVLLLDSAQDDARLAARVAHLFLHLNRGQSETSGQDDADDERDAHELEARVLSRLQRRR